MLFIGNKKFRVRIISPWGQLMEGDEYDAEISAQSQILYGTEIAIAIDGPIMKHTTTLSMRGVTWEVVDD